MSRQQKLFKGSVVALIAALLGYAVVANIQFDSTDEPIATAGSLLSWSKPMASTGNGARIDMSGTDISGYKIYCWRAADGRVEIIQIDDPARTNHEINDLASGTYQCAIKSVDSQGFQSALSNVVTRTVP